MLALGPTVGVRPFTRAMWEAIASDVSSVTTPPISESIFCDGLLSAVAGDELKALLELGVACEVELTQLLDAAARLAPTSPDKAKFLTPKGETTKGDFEKFCDKLKTWPQRLGLDDVASYPVVGVPPNWITLVEDLYRLRGGVAHSGKKKSGGASVQDYIFSANALFKYSSTQKTRLGINQYRFSPTDDPRNQIICYRDGTIFSNATQNP